VYFGFIEGSNETNAEWWSGAVHILTAFALGDLQVFHDCSGFVRVVQEVAVIL
jgi:hypothetical protein